MNCHEKPLSSSQNQSITTATQSTFFSSISNIHTYPFKMRFFAEIIPMAFLLVGVAQADDPKANEYTSSDW